jgi:MazG family protein
VFGDVVANDPAAVLRNWEQIKQQEHKKELRHSALDGVPDSLPALLKAQRTQEKASRVGFDWKDAKGPLEKIKEEIRELEEAVSESSDTSLDPHVKEELGDLIFAVTNLARHLKADAESALENTTKKFSRRFRAVEAGAKAQGRNLKDMTLAEMDALWDEAKSAESMH